ncbi:MAG: DMT family transporter [Anaerolineales bacterium]|nr:DMT family transporter [Anaerolineales bacterium]
MPNSFLGLFFALTSAFVWGSGDFSGGFATRKSNPYHVLALSTFSGIGLLVVCALIWGEAFPAWKSVGWAILAGAWGMVGLAALYRALSKDDAARVAPVSAVIGAALPVGFSALTLGLPAPLKLVGFALAFVGIWLVSQGETKAHPFSRPGFLLACLAGVGFGGYFILIAQVEAGKVFTPLVIARTTAFLISMGIVRFYRLPFPKLNSSPIGLLAGVLDAGGNIFYLLAQQYARLDVVVVLASLFPATTVLLSAVLLKEKVSRGQWVGVAVCLLAIVLISR